ncbi:DUF4394 domain-containing protein [Paraconexibacter sp. AEG42_29]|uniref:DUF4394 domain-containing protein n=1 Tax=Paraconexibacter sp. AEG42_29 TaxID=2997339 RepID=UPI00339D6542
MIGAVAAGAAIAPGAHAAPAKVAYGLSGTNLLSFDPATPGTTQTVAISGIVGGETLVGIDVRPQNGRLYALGVNAGADTATVYVIGSRTGVASPVGTPGAIAFVAPGDGVTPIDLPDPATVGYGFDFNPAVDRIRVVAGSLDFRANPNTGGPVDNDGNLGNGFTADGNTNGGTSTVDAAAYTNNVANNGITTLYTLDAASNAVYIQNPPNNGTQTLAQPITLNGNPLDFTGVSGFDIDAAVLAPASNMAAPAGSVAFAALNVGGTTSLYSIVLASGNATLIGTIGAGTTAIQGLALQDDFDRAGFPTIALTSDGAALLRFYSATPSVATVAPVTGLVAGDTLVGVTWRPQTGQLIGVGVNAGADTIRLYVVDPQSGASTAIGAGPTGYVDNGGATIDLPSPATVAYGIDFNPTVDRVRIVTAGGLNARANPVTGATVDGNAGAAGTQPDGNINGGGVTGVNATSYTNAFTQSLIGGTTTQYTLDAGTDSLYIQNPPNNGTQTTPLPLTLGGSPVDFSAFVGLDIPGDVAVATSTAVAVGDGLIAGTVAGTTRVYTVNLSTGALTSLGPIGTGLVLARSIAVGDAQRDPAVLSAAPAALAFPSRAVNAGPSAVQTTVVTNDGGSPATLTALAVTGTNAGDFNRLTGGPADCAVGTVLLAGATCNVRVTFDPSNVGGRSATLTVSSNAPALTVALSGTGGSNGGSGAGGSGTGTSGTANPLAAGPGTLDFGSRDVADGTSTPLTTTVRNGGSSPLTLSGLTLTGADAAAFALLAAETGDCKVGTVLAPGETCTVRITFDPATVGDAVATLSVTAGTATATVQLSGRGTSRTASVVIPDPPATPAPGPGASQAPVPTAPAVPSAPVPPATAAPGTPATPAAPAKPAVAANARFTRSGKAALTGGGTSLNTGIVVACPTTRSSACTTSVRVGVRGRRGRLITIGSTKKAYSVRAGRTQKLQVTLTAVGRRLLRNADGQRLTVTVTYRTAGGKQARRLFAITVG